MSGWARLQAAVKEANLLHGRGSDPISGYVGWHVLNGKPEWYGGTAYEADPMEETAIAGSDLADMPTFYKTPHASEADYVADMVAQAVERDNARIRQEREE